jgi:hypothetical protein
MFDKILQSAANAILLHGGKAISTAQTIIRVETAGRSLTEEEKRQLKTIFLDSVDLDAIRLKLRRVGLFGLSPAPFTHADTIYIPDKGWLTSGSDAVSIELLAHETTHVWQYQNGGANYMRESLIEQFHGWRKAGTRGAAYDYEKGIAEGKTWAELNPEQQAKLIEHCWNAGLFSDPNARFAPYGIDRTEYAREAIRQLQNGKGAP